MLHNEGYVHTLVVDSSCAGTKTIPYTAPGTQRQFLPKYIENTF